MKKARLTPDAKQDIIGIRDYYKRRRDPDAARRILAKVRATYGELGEQPLIGDLRDDLAPDLRCGYAGSWLVFYRPTARGIEIMRILSASRDIQPYMFRDPTE